jgi:hypothetical protein
MIDQSEILSRSQVQFITLFFGGAQLCCDFTNHAATLNEFGAEKPISFAKLAQFNFFTLNFTVCSHILSTDGDALGASPPQNCKQLL